MGFYFTADNKAVFQGVSEEVERIVKLIQRSINRLYFTLVS
jgi:hypothetical protein